MQIAQVALRSLELVFLIITTGLIGNVIAEAFSGNPGYINYAIFVCVFAWLNIIYGFLAAFMETLAIPIVLGVFDLLTTFFTFVAGVVLAAKLGVHSCGNDDYTRNNPATNGSADPQKRCQQLQASTAFFWFMFACFAASTVIAFLSGRSMTTARSGGLRKGGPSMSQV